MNKICYYIFGVNLPFFVQYVLAIFIFYNPLNKLLKNKYFRVGLIFLIPTIIFISILRNDPFFLSDDFAHIHLVTKNTYSQILTQALSPEGIWVKHRIFTAFWLFKAVFELFGTNAVAYYSLGYIFQILNVFLFYFFLNKLRPDSNIAVLISIVYSSIYFSWISNIHEIVAGTLVLSALVAWFYFLKRKKNIYLWLTVLFYLIALFTKEISFLFVPALVLVTVSYYFIVAKVDIKKTIYAFIPLFLIFVAYLVFYASGFLSYAKLPEGGGYHITFALVPIVKNMAGYFSFMIPILGAKAIRVIVFILLFIGFDIFKKKPIVTPYLLSSLVFILPPSLFDARFSGYYTYISAIFLFIGLFLIFSGISDFYKKSSFFKQKLLTRVLGSFLVILFVFGVFNINKTLLDNCFLIQYPWRKEYKEAFYSLVNRIDELSKKGKLTNGYVISLDKNEQIGEIDLILGDGVLPPFLKDSQAKQFFYRYDPSLKTLTVEKR